ncbi:AAA-ATPase At2g46620-like [Aegilops tauschii subsp. strangulata]
MRWCRRLTDLPVLQGLPGGAGGDGGPCTRVGSLRTDLGENLPSASAKAGGGGTICVVPFLKASQWRSSRPLSATSGKNPRSDDRMTAALWGRSSFGGVILGATRVGRTRSYKLVARAARRLWQWADEWAQANQYYKVPCFGGGDGAENPLFRKAAAYVASLPSLEDADVACVLSSARKSNDFSLQLGPGHTAHDAFLGACLACTNGGERLVLRVRRHDRSRMLRPYLQHVVSVADVMELCRRELRLYANTGALAPRWASALFTHLATLDAVAMDPELKTRVRSDLESFLKGRAYYHCLGRVWRRSYLLYGPPGTGKSTFAAAMARFLRYDIYDIDLSRAGADELRALLVDTAPRSLTGGRRAPSAVSAAAVMTGGPAL